MDIRLITLFLSNILVFLAYILYIHSILANKAKPHRTTRLVIFLITGLATLALFAQGNQTAIWLAGVSMIMSLIILLLSFKYGMGGWAKIDILSLVIAAIGIAVWRVTDNPQLGLFASILADFSGVVPTLIKTYHQPETEDWIFFALGATGSLLNLLSVRTWTLEEFSYPLYLLLINSYIVFLVLRKRLIKSMADQVTD